MGPKTEEEMAIELFDAFQRLVSSVERIADVLCAEYEKKHTTGTGIDFSLTQAKATEGPKLPFDTH